MFQPNYQIEESQHQNWCMPQFHFHDSFQFFLPISGTGTLHTPGNSYPFHANTLFFLGINTLHRTEAEGAHRRILLHIEPETLATFSTYQTDFTLFNKLPQQMLLLSQSQQEETLRLLRDIIRHPNDGNFGSDIHQTMALLDLFIYLTPLFQSQSVPAPHTSKEIRRITPILEYIQENLAEPLNLDQLSAVFYLSKHHLCRLFKSTTGFTVMEYMIHSRIAHARTLLQQGYTVQGAGERSGFTDNSHFIRTFGKLTGTSPGKYSKLYQSSQQVHLLQGNGTNHTAET